MYCRRRWGTPLGICRSTPKAFKTIAQARRSRAPLGARNRHAMEPQQGSTNGRRMVIRCETPLGFGFSRWLPRVRRRSGNPGLWCETPLAFRSKNMPVITVKLQTAVRRTFRVEQIAGMFDVPLEELGHALS